MPVYEYRCGKCGEHNEFLETAGKRLAKACKHCGSSDLQKLMSVFSPRVKAGSSKRCHGCSDYKCPHAGN